MDLKLENKACIVTGASRGIGREIALALGSEKARVACVATNEALLAETAKAVQERGGQALAIVADVSSAADADRVIAETQKAYGAIDLLVNNAGVTRDNLLLRMKDEEWDRVMAVNLKGAFLLTRAVARPMLRQRSGKIVNITSVVGMTGNAGQANYAASKAGLIALTKSVAKELASRGICVNAIAPGLVDTDMVKAMDAKARETITQAIPLGRLGTGADIASAVLYLASPVADYVTGQVLVVDGGMTM
ncbi:MAG: 3-oxoacyl-[acyl-carrier-protein] reductase [Planctomycetota bacterium]